MDTSKATDNRPKRRPGNTQISLSLPVKLREQIKQRAADDMRNVSSYLTWLAVQDLKRVGGKDDSP